MNVYHKSYVSVKLSVLEKESLKRIFSILMLVTLCVGALALASKVQPAKTAIITVPDDYSTIQDAINHANAGDTICVRDGVYAESIDINVSVTLIGENNQNTTLEPDGNIGVYITAGNVSLENFNILTPSFHEIVIWIDGRGSHCSGSTIRNNVLQCSYDIYDEAIDIMGSKSNIVADNKIVLEGPSDSGIALLFDANHNTIDNNTIMGGWVCLYDDFNEGSNVFSNNYISNQTVSSMFPTVGALHLSHTSGDIIRGNTFVNNGIGFDASWGQPSCIVYNNNFINNTQQALVASDSSIIWDDGYPSGGNYWSDYNGTDLFYGPLQNRVGSDGIGDSPYVVGADNIDHYPLMKPWNSSVEGDINGDGKVDLKDCILLACAYGSTSGCANWDKIADVNQNGRVDLIDLVTLAVHYRQHYP
jgi:nitrous oxidase accessory protein NosD